MPPNWRKSGIPEIYSRDMEGMRAKQPTGEAQRAVATAAAAAVAAAEAPVANLLTSSGLIPPWAPR